MSCPRPSALSALAEKHLGSYALAATAVGLLTNAQVADAKVQMITYNPHVLNPASGSGLHADSFQLFTNGPTLTLLNVTNSTYLLAGARTSHGLAFIETGNYATNLAAGAAISAGKTFVTVPTNLKLGYDRQIGYYRGPGGKGYPNNGNFISKTGYLGFKFTDPTVSTQTDFGWVQIKENFNQNTLTIISSAYDDSGLGILAGSVTTVPESTSVGLLAAGACGLGLWRRRAALRREARGRGGAAEASTPVA